MNRAYLDGIMNEVVLKIKDGTASIQAVDASTSLFVSAQEPMKGSADTTLGIAPINVLVSFLGSGGEFTFTATDKFLRVKKT